MLLFHHLQGRKAIATLLAFAHRISFRSGLFHHLQGRKAIATSTSASCPFPFLNVPPSPRPKGYCDATFRAKASGVSPVPPSPRPKGYCDSFSSCFISSVTSCSTISKAERLLRPAPMDPTAAAQSSSTISKAERLLRRLVLEAINQGLRRFHHLQGRKAIATRVCTRTCRPAHVPPSPRPKGYCD